MNKKLTRKQINEKLDALRRSRLCNDSYDIVPNSMACCYSINLPRYTLGEHHCENCQEDFICKEPSGDAEYIDTLVKRLKFAGLIAKAVYYCEDCAKKYKKSSVEIWVKPVDSKNWVISVPQGGRFSTRRGPKCIEDNEYVIIENILTYRLYGGTNAAKNGASNYKFVFENEEYRNRSGIIKFQVDAAVYKVLGIDFEYDMNEIKKGIKAWLLYNLVDHSKHDEYERFILENLDISENNSIKYSKFEKEMDKFCIKNGKIYKD